MKKIAAFAGSTSSTSINKQLATYAGAKITTAEVTVLDLNDFDVPLFSEDFEKNNEYPKGAENFNSELDKYDGFIVSLAEHNGSYAATFKNLFDWVSRKNREVFRNKQVLLMATSPGGRGGATVLAAAEGTFPHMGAAGITKFSLGSFYDNFKEGAIVNEELGSQLSAAVSAFENKI